MSHAADLPLATHECARCGRQTRVLVLLDMALSGGRPRLGICLDCDEELLADDGREDFERTVRDRHGTNLAP
jgi:hypothetical protein